MIQSIDRSTCRLLRDKINESLQELAQELGVTIEAGNASFTNSNVTFKVNIATKNEDGSVNTKEAEDFRRYAARYGLKPDDLGREFTSNGKRFKITGAKPRASRYPILAERIPDGKGYKFAPFQVQVALK